jgi:hypothetical protein
MYLGFFHLFVMVALHDTYVGPHAFRRQREVGEGNDILVTCIAKALATRPPEERSRYHVLFGEENNARRRLDEAEMLLAVDDGFLSFNATIPTNTQYYYYDDDPWQSRFLEEKQVEFKQSSSSLHPLLGKDEILQIKILYGGRCTGQCSRVRYVRYPQKVEKARLFQQRPDVMKANTTKANSTSTNGSSLRGSRQVRKMQLTNDTLESKGHNASKSPPLNEDNYVTNILNTDEFSTPEFWEDPSYRFSIDDALLYLDEKSIYLHNITIVNVTVTERCLSTGSDDGE